jgi:hypothetical protein
LSAKAIAISYTGLPGREVRKLPEILLLFAEFLPAADGHIAARQPAIPSVSSPQAGLNLERFSGR